MEDHQLKYKFNDEFSSKVKKGYGTKQSITAGDKVKINDEEIVVTLSKGPKIKVPNLTKMDVTKLTEWAIKNKLKLKFTDKYDDSVKRGDIIKTNKNEGDILKQGDTVEVTLSRGSLKMPKFDNFDDFSKWADKYEIKYEEEHEFNDNIDEGQIISFSYKTGEIIKNNDSIIVKISNGKKVTVPNLNGLTKKEAIKKLEDSQLNYNFIYKNSSKDKDIVIGQSVSSGSSVSKNMTITVTLSNGPKPADPTPTPAPTPTCRPAVFYIRQGNTGVQTFNATKAAYPDFKIYANYVDQCSNGDSASGSVCNSGTYDDKHLSSCDNIYLTIVK